MVFLETGYHFAETIGTRDWIASVMDIRVLSVEPEKTVAEQDAEFGPQLHDRDPDLCCDMRKVQPLARTLAGFSAWGSGVRRDESGTPPGRRSSTGTPARHGEGQPARRLDPGRRRPLQPPSTRCR